METKYYTGNYTLGIGQPYVILSIDQDPNYFHSEKIIIFDGFDGQKSFHAYRTKYPIMTGGTMDDFISTEIQTCKEDILHKILFSKYYTQIQAINFNVKIELVETNANVLGLLRDKFPTELENIKSRSINEKLKLLIALYQSIIIERNDFEIDK